MSILLGLVISSCEKQIYPALENTDPTLVIDAWVNDKPEEQTIILSKSQPYFENKTPPAVIGASIKITDNNNQIFHFVESSKKPGNYTWNPTPTQKLGPIGAKFKLSITVEGENYEATSTIGKVPPIDSIVFKKNEPTDRNPDFFRAQFYANDVVGKGDSYWIRTYKNGNLIIDPLQINVAYDASPSIGDNLYSRIIKNEDGKESLKLETFIFPVRIKINPIEYDENQELISPYVLGDSVYVEIHSITREAFEYWTQVSTQVNKPGGFSELFAKPIANVSTNIINVNPSGKKAMGFFNVSSVSGKGKKFKSIK